ncbi:MAG: hypothetical protein ACREAX_00185 [Candidatus Nitrosotenuis sp.]
MKKVVLGAIMALFFASGLAFAQEVSFGDPANQAVKITINENGDAHVIHVVEDSKKPQQLQVIQDDFINLQILDENGGIPQYGETGGEKTSFIIFPNDDKVIVDYDLPNAVTQVGGLWTWHYVYLASTAFYLPEKTDLIFANTNPVNLGDHQGIRCHGCEITLEYELEKTETTKQAQWENKKFDVRIITQTGVTSFEFDQPNKKISFDVSEADKYITLIIPLELLWNPYEVFLDGEKILKHEFYSDGKDIWLNIKPSKAGKVEIIGVSAVPEFPIAALLVLGVAMVFAAKFTKLNLR